MSYAETETSVAEGSPVHLVLVRYGPEASSHYGFTDHERDIVYFEPTVGQEVVFKAVPMDVDEIRSNGTLQDANTEVRIDGDVELVKLFRLYPPSQTVSVFIREGHADDPDGQFLLKFSGRIIGYSEPNDSTSFTCESIASSMRRNGLRRNYQYGCPHVLYGPSCRASKPANTIAIPAVAATNGAATVELPVGWAADYVRYQGGIAEWARADDGRKEYRTILRASATDVILAGPAFGVAAGTVLSLSRGCKHTMDDCYLFDNILNYGGQPWIPLRNPIGIVNNFY